MKCFSLRDFQPFPLLPLLFSPSFSIFLHPPARSLWSTVLSTGWSVTCGVYVSVCLTVYSELILTHSINLSYNRSTPTCPLESVRVRFRCACVCFGRVCTLDTCMHDTCSSLCLRHPICIFLPDLCACAPVVVAGQSFQIDAEMLYVLLSGLMTCL